MNENAMNDEVRTVWVERLREGKRAQTQKVLHQVEDGGLVPAGYCCLGVLEELACEIGIAEVLRYGGDVDPDDPDQTSSYEARYRDVGEFDSSTTYMTPKAAEWAGLDQFGTFHLPIANGQSAEQLTLADLNDEGLTFAQIADVIDYFFRADREGWDGA